MFGTHDLLLFIVTGLLLNIAPGVDFLYVLSRSASGGTRAGVWAALGIGAGCLVHITAAALGLSAVLASSAIAFSVVKWVGAAYLVYVGLTMVLKRREIIEIVPHAGSPGAKRVPVSVVFWQGFLTNALNPKVALFFLAFVPQFIDATSPTKVYAFLFLGAIFNTTGTLWNFFVAWAAGYLSARLRLASSTGLWLNRSLGALFIALGVRLGLSGRS
jgi:threonine/homoserine/homoserine lactone efflux protein